MSRFILYLPECDSVMMDGVKPYVGSKKEVTWTLNNEVVHPKKYELRPATFLRNWAKKQVKLEQDRNNRPYRFSPGFPDFRYVAPKGQKKYLLIVGDGNVANSGSIVKDFDTQAEAYTLAHRSIKGLTKAFPKFGYYIFNTESREYSDRIINSGESTGGA